MYFWDKVSEVPQNIEGKIAVLEYENVKIF